MGRPSSYTAEIGERICKRLEAGSFFAHALELEGIPERTGWQWLESAEKPGASEALVEFSQACTRARAIGEQVYLDRIEIKSAATQGTDWKADAWTLTRMRPARYKETIRTEVTGADGGPVELIDAAARVTSRIDRLAAAAAAGAAPEGAGTDT